MHGLQNPGLFREACFLNGQWVQAENKARLTVTNPADGTTLGYVPNCSHQETNNAIQSAAAALSDWQARSVKERADMLWRFVELINKNKEDLARIMTLEEGKPIAESRNEIDYANAFMRWFAEEGRRTYGDIIPSNVRKQHLLVIKQAIGVVAAITPWNFPAAMITRKLAPALAAGCTMVLKPDSATPFSALALAVLAEEAELPAGVFNIITGEPQAIGEEMTRNPLVRKLSFTGSTRVGRLLMAQSAPTIKKLSLELGGNAPFIVFDDADMDAAVTGAIASKFRNAGQTCVCANRILVQRSIYEAFSKKLVAAVKQLKVGNGMTEGVQIGPLINAKGLEKVQGHVADAIAKGATLLCGGQLHTLGGNFFEPTVLGHANATMLVAQEETFGPVAPLFIFEDEAEAIQMANDTEFGLASYFYARDMDRIWRVSTQLQAGIVGVNTGIISTEVAPFGGVKQSGIGREGSKYGIEEYLEIKYLCMNTG